VSKEFLIANFDFDIRERLVIGEGGELAESRSVAIPIAQGIKRTVGAVSKIDFPTWPLMMGLIEPSQSEFLQWTWMLEVWKLCR
jgi:hypothetical protein